MTDDERLLAHARDLQQTAADEGRVTHTAFLDLHQRTLLQPLLREQTQWVQTCFYGGYQEAERTVAVFMPRFLQAETPQALFKLLPEEKPLKLLRLEKDKFSTLSHRDYLGALMGLSIKRETLGDIVPDETGAFLVCLKTVAPFLLQNLKSAGRAAISVFEAQWNELAKREPKLKIVFASVASLRLDAVLGAAFSLSRSAAGEAVHTGLVFVNGVQAQKTDQRLEPGDQIVLRGKGKTVLLEISGMSKKGRMHIRIGRYV